MLKRVFALFLAMTMVLSMLPMSAFAADGEDVMETIQEEAVEETQPLEEEPTETEEPVTEEPTEEEPQEETEADVPEAEPEEEAEVDTAVRYEKISFINPLYRDILTEEDLVPHDPADNQPFASSTVYKNLADAGAYVRSQMVRRASNISLSLRTTSSDYNALFYGLMDTAVAHTGNPKEGDYLGFQYAGWNGSLSYSMDGGYYVYNFDLTVTYYTTASQETKVDGAVQEVLTKLDLEGRSAYERTRRIYKYICDNVEYDYDHLGNDSYKLQFTAYAALINGTSVCQGYAVLLYRLALEAGIDCRVIPGIGNGGPHAWNIAQLDKLYYNLDSTWDAGMSEKNYGWFLRCNAKFPDHYREPEYETAEFNAAYPMASKNYTPPAEPEGITGKCGENLTWQLTDDGVLRITGTGAMADYDATSSPWYSNRSSIKTVVIEDGVTSIGRYAFNGCENLTSVTIPASVVDIGNGAFSECVKVGKLYISSIESWMKIFFLPWGTSPLESSASYYDENGNRKYNTDIKVYVNGTLLKSLVIPEGTTTIPCNAFVNWDSVETVTIPKSVSHIEAYAFQNCDGLKKISLPDSVKQIDGGVFYECGGLTSVTMNNSIKSIGDGLFFRCTSLTSVSLPDSVTSISRDAFAGCSSLTNITIPDGVKNIGDYAFSGCSSLKSMTLPDSVMSIGIGAFSECSSLTSVTIPDGVRSIGESVFYHCSSLSNVTIPESVTSIGKYAFSACSSLESLTIPDSVKSIGEWAFRNCTSLASVEFGRGVGSIGGYAFAQDKKLKTIYFTGDAPKFEKSWAYDERTDEEFEAYPFYGVTATAYYPCSNRTWTAAVLQDYSGKLTWVKQHRNAGNICPDCGQILGAYVRAITGPKVLRGGSSATFQAQTSEKAAVLWKLRPQDGAFASITGAGKLTTKVVAEAAEIVVTAYLKDTPSVSLDYKLSVVPGAEEVILSCTTKNIVDGIIGLNYDKTNEVQLSAELLPGDAIQSGTWKSSSAKIAKVDENGLVKFLKTGTVTITFTASDGSKQKASVKIIAGIHADGLTVTGEDTLTSGSKTTLKTKLTGEPTVKKLTWVSSDPNVATVSAKGVVTAKTVYEAAKVTITAKTTDGSGVEAQHVITVQPKDNVLPIREGREVVNGKTLTIDESVSRITLTAPAGTKWKSSSAAVAAVEDGVVTIGKAGSATITAASADGKQTGKVTIKVSRLVKSLTITPSDSQPLISGKSKVTLTAKVNADAANKAVTWTSSDPTIATVSSKGVVTAKAGVKKNTQVTITAAAKDGSGVSKSVTLTVIPAETMVSIVNHTAITTADGMKLGAGEVLNGRTLVLHVGTDFRLDAVVYPNTREATARQDVTWSFSAKGIVGVSPDGTMSGMKPGSVTVTVKTASGKTNTVKLKFV